MDKSIGDFNISRDADHFIIAELVGQVVTVKDILIELFLPHNNEEEVVLICKPNSQQYNDLNKEYEFSINGYDEFSDGSINNNFFVKRAFRKKSHPTFYTSKLRDFTIVLQAYDLMIVCERDNPQGNGETKGYFTIFNRFQVPPLKSLLRKPNGEVTVDPREKYSFVLESGVKLTFDIFYRYENTEDYTKSYPYAVAEFKTDLDPERINEIIVEIDDFLLLVSLALETICVCTGWIAFSNSKKVTYYRRDRVIPDKEESSSYSEYLIEPFELITFLEKSYKAFIGFNDRELLRNILFPLVRRKKISIETHYLILFAILESIILNYKKNNNYEFILRKDDFNNLKNDLKEFIKLKLSSIDKIKRKFIYEKLSELNRVSFPSSLELYQKHYNIKIDDLWPLFDSKTGASLADIRNKIIHGETFSNHQFQAISFAMHHLQIIVERMVLSLLSWNISKSRVSSEYTKQHFAKDFEKVKYYQKLFEK